MTRVDLITGFLGSGKTTFIRKYLKHLKDQGEHVHIIENEFGSAAIDSRLLRDEDCSIDDLAGCCMCCTGRDKFISMLIQAARDGCDRVLVEPSGIYDVDEFFSVMETDAVKKYCEIGSILTIVDARIDDHLSLESDYLMYAQLLAAGRIIFSKTQMYEEGTCAETIRQLNAIIDSMGGGRVLGDDVFTKDWDHLSKEDFDSFDQSGCRRIRHHRRLMEHQEIYMTVLIAERCAGLQDLKERIRKLFDDPSLGQVIRVKGYMKDLDNNWYEANCTRTTIEVIPVTDIRRGLLVVIGQQLNEPLLRQAFLPRK